MKGFLFSLGTSILLFVVGVTSLSQPLKNAASPALHWNMETEATPSNWFTNLATAQTYAEKNETSILMVFAGSDWCRPCIQFKKEILQSVDFQNYAAENLAILYLDFPARKKNQLPEQQTKHNEALADQYNRSGAFPKIVLLDVFGDLQGEIEYKTQQSLDFIANCQSIIE